MKKKLLICTLPLLLINSLRAQDEVEFELKSNVLAVRYSNFNIGFEHFLGPYAAIDVYVGASVPTVLFEPSFSSYYLRPEFRYYSAREEECSGLFTGAYLNFRSRGDMYASDTNAYAIQLSQSVFDMCVGINLGYKAIFEDRFSIEVNLGLGRYFYAVGSETGRISLAKFNDDFENSLELLDLRLGINLGYRFEY